MAIYEDPEGHEIAAVASTGVAFAGRRVLDVGCGDGRLTKRCAHEAASIIAIDPDPDAIARLAAAWPAVDARPIPIDRLQLPARSIDVVLFSWSL